MQKLTKRRMAVIEDYDHFKTMDENVKWMTPTPLLSIFSKPLGFFCAFTFSS